MVPLDSITTIGSLRYHKCGNLVPEVPIAPIRSPKYDDCAIFKAGSTRVTDRALSEASLAFYVAFLCSIIDTSKILYRKLKVDKNKYYLPLDYKSQLMKSFFIFLISNNNSYIIRAHREPGFNKKPHDHGGDKGGGNI